MSAPSLTALSLPNKLLVQFVLIHAPISTVALAAAQGVPADGLAPFVDVLKNLQTVGYLAQVDGLWVAASDPTAAVQGDEPDDAPRLVPPRQNNLMHGPTWCPPPDTTLRPGSKDFLKVPSRGYRC